ncbi:MAG: hypothetical protein II304_05800 [Bacteroidales bacterium]|nr:hypothetical protein [Bacteroidales bacterium]
MAKIVKIFGIFIAMLSFMSCEESLNGINEFEETTTISEENVRNTKAHIRKPIPINTTIRDIKGDIWDVQGYVVIEVKLTSPYVVIIEGEITIRNRRTGEEITFLGAPILDSDGNVVDFDGTIVDGKGNKVPFSDCEDLLNSLNDLVTNNYELW